MKQKWVIRNIKGDVNAVSAEQGVNPYIARVLINRGLDTKEKRDVYMHPSVYGLRDGKLLKNAVQAGELIKTAVRDKKKIRIIGDYDVDGVTSTYILYRGLLGIGADVSYRIPDRIADGYGLNRNMVDEAISDGVNFILTCDNGISEYDNIAWAKENGLTVVVTDHHEVPRDDNGMQILPPADVIVNPKQDNETTPYVNICGCVVAMKVLDAMGLDIMPFLPYAAMATYCDVMDLEDENRTIAVLGLKGMRECADIGLKALILANALEPALINSYQIGFVIGPCINASGRLKSALLGLELLLETDAKEAQKKAEKIVSLNAERKAMTENGVNRAKFILDTVASKRAEAANDKDISKYYDKIIVVYLEDCHESIAGIVAGRIREMYQRPVFIVTNSGEDGMLKGSGRSIEGWSMYEEMAKISDVFLRFGGHPMAAGFSLKAEKLSEMQKRLNECCMLTEDDFCKKIKIDAKLPFEYVNTELCEQLELFEPTGKGNEKPLFAEKDLRVVKAAVIGKNKNVLKLTVINERGFKYDGISFTDVPSFINMTEEAFGPGECDKMFKGLPNGVRLNATYVPEKNEYRGFINLQAKFIDFMAVKQ